MSKHTTLPYMYAEPFVNGDIDQYRIFCELCEYRTLLSNFYTCEMEAADHLDAAHAQERAEADAKVSARAEELRRRDPR